MSSRFEFYDVKWSSTESTESVSSKSFFKDNEPDCSPDGNEKSKWMKMYLHLYLHQMKRQKRNWRCGRQCSCAIGFFKSSKLCYYLTGLTFVFLWWASFQKVFLMMVVRLVTFKQWCWIITIQKVKKSNRQNEKQIFQKYWGRLPWCIYFTFTYESGIRIDNGHIEIN